jgi:small redox-active disulfide protein 2
MGDVKARCKIFLGEILANLLNNVEFRSMKQLQILGTGCAKCTNLAAATEQAAKTLGIEYEMEKVTDLNRIMSFGVMMTPALVVDGKVKSAGRVPSLEDIKKMLL